MARSWIKKALVASALIGCSGTANATEPAHWTGFYYGMTVGYHQTDLGNNLTSTALDSTNALIVALARAASGAFGRHQEGFTGGIQYGFSWKVGNAVIAGVETDIQGLTGSVFETRVTTGSTVSIDAELEFLATARGRLGVLVLPSLLVYGTGGLAVGFADSGLAVAQTLFASDDSGSNNHTLVGWTVGAGIERFFQGTWSLRAEYLYYDLGEARSSLTVLNQDVPVGAQPIPYMQSVLTTPITGQIARVGLTFRLN